MKSNIKIFNSKKADSFNILEYAFVRFIMIGILFVIIAIFASSMTNTKIHVSDLKSSIFANRLMNSYDGISYFSPYTGRIYPGEAVKSKFTVNSLNSTNGTADLKDKLFSGEKFGAAITLIETETNKSYELYLDRESFERYYPLSKFEQYHVNLYWRYLLFNSRDSKNINFNYFSNITYINKATMLIRTAEND